MNVVKFIGAWGCLIASALCIFLFKDIALATTCGVLSIAFSQAPTNG